MQQALRQKIGISQEQLDGIQTTKIHQLTLISWKQLIASKQKTYMGYDDPANAAAAQVGLKEYDKLVDEAAKKTDDLNARYEKIRSSSSLVDR